MCKIPEARYRCATTTSPLRTLRKKVFVLQLPFTRKWLLAESLTITRLAYNAHTDAFLNISGTNIFRNRYMHIVRTAAGCISVPKIGKICSDAEALSIAEALPWEQFVAIERSNMLVDSCSTPHNV